MGATNNNWATLLELNSCFLVIFLWFRSFCLNVVYAFPCLGFKTVRAIAHITSPFQSRVEIYIQRPYLKSATFTNCCKTQNTQLSYSLEHDSKRIAAILRLQKTEIPTLSHLTPCLSGLCRKISYHQRVWYPRKSEKVATWVSVIPKSWSILP